MGAPLWPDTADDILDGDQVTALAYATPARGVVVTPVTNLALRDREAGRVMAVNTSVGVWKKLERIRGNPQVALAYHTRAHGFSDRPEYVLVQGRASLSAPVPNYPRTIPGNWERFAGPADYGPLWSVWLRAWLLRVELEIAVERVVVWPDLSCGGAPEVHGAALPGSPPEPQRPPAKGTGPRIDHVRAAKRAGSLPNVLLGWVGSDGYPVVAPVEVAGPDDRGILLDLPEGLAPPGGRRAGLTAHWFARYTVGQTLRKHTGWLEADGGGRRVLYAPHTEKGYRLPESAFLFKLVAGGATWWGLRGARRAGMVGGG